MASLAKWLSVRLRSGCGFKPRNCQICNVKIVISMIEISRTLEYH